jgi:membrane associated rhomboid family serine protease
VITRFLIVLNVVGYAWEILVGGSAMLSGFGGAGMQRVLVDGALIPVAVLQDGQWWRIVTGAFLHGGLIHIGVNMVSLWFLGRFI